MCWNKMISQDLSLKQVSDGYAIFAQYSWFPSIQEMKSRNTIGFGDYTELL